MRLGGIEAFARAQRVRGSTRPRHDCDFGRIIAVQAPRLVLSLIYFSRRFGFLSRTRRASACGARRSTAGRVDEPFPSRAIVGLFGGHDSRANRP